MRPISSSGCTIGGQLPSPRKAPVRVVQTILRLYRDVYRGFNMRHFHALLRRDHDVTLSYSFVRLALQEAGPVAKRRARGRHRRAGNVNSMSFSHP